MKSLFALIGVFCLSYGFNWITFTLSSLPCEVREVQTSAMHPTLKRGDSTIVEKFSPYLNRPFKRGEVVIFYPEFLDAQGKNNWHKLTMALNRIRGNSNERAYIRRVAALPGDVVELYCSSAKIRFPDRYIPEKAAATAPAPTNGKVIKIVSEDKQNCMARYLIPKGYLFVIGDGTDYMGMIEEVKVFGRPQFRISDFGTIDATGDDKFVISTMAPEQ